MLLDGATSLDKFCEQHDICRATAYREISAGRLVANKIGRKTVITKAAAKAWLEALPKFGTDRGDVAA